MNRKFNFSILSDYYYQINIFSKYFPNISLKQSIEWMNVAKYLHACFSFTYFNRKAYITLRAC